MRLNSLSLSSLRSLSRSWLSLAMVLGFFVGCSAQSTVQKAPDFSLTDLQGKPISLKEFRGKVVFLDFWATWCPPCVQSAPEVEKMADEYKGKDVQVIRISLDNEAETVRNFLARHPTSVATRVAMTDGNVDAVYGVNGIPAFFIIDPNGNLRKSWGGYHPMMPQIWRKEIDRLLTR